MALTQESILNALKNVKYPGYTRDIVSFGFVKNIHLHEGHLAVSLELASADPQITETLKGLVTEALKPFEKQANIELHFSVRDSATGKSAPTRQELPNIKHRIAIASGKGGVGKTTVTVNLAYALQKTLGAKVAILDCDIYGPTVPLMLGARGEPMIDDGKLVPFEAHGIKVMSMGLLIDENTPVVWRGPMITKAIHQFTAQVAWGDVDYLMIDLPPGTGDAQLSLAQLLKLDGVLIVTTPQQAAAEVASRGAQMWAKVDVPILGVIENMSYYVLPGGKKEFIFGTGGGKWVADELQMPLLAELPVDSTLRESADGGKPILLKDEKNPSAEIYAGLAKKLQKIIQSKNP